MKERVGDVNVDDRGLWREPKESRIVDIVVEVRGKLARDVLEKCLVFFSFKVPYSPRGFDVDLAASCLAWSLTISSWLSHPYVISGCVWRCSWHCRDMRFARG